MSQRKPFKKFQRKGPSLTQEQKIEKFILRNSQNGFFTKVTTLPYKFEISESKAWEIIGELLSLGSIESIHDEITGEMKLCASGKTYLIMDLEKKRKRQKPKFKKKAQKSNKENS